MNGAELRTRRQAAGLSISELARRAGATREHLTRAEAHPGRELGRLLTRALAQELELAGHGPGRIRVEVVAGTALNPGPVLLERDARELAAIPGWELELPSCAGCAERWRLRVYRPGG